MFKNTVEIMDRRAIIKAQADTILSRCRQEIRELTDEERAEFERIKEEAQKLNEEEQALKERVNQYTNPVEDSPAEEEKRNFEKIKLNKENKMEKRFSLVKAIRDIANGQPFDDVTRAVVNAGAEEARAAGISCQGQIQLPIGNFETRAAVTVNSEGEDIVATDLFDLWTPLRAKSVLADAGARFYSNLVGNVQIPLMDKVTNVGWAGEISDAPDGAPTFSHVTLSPKRLTAFVDISKMMLAQDSLDVENAIRNDLIAAIRSKLESTILGSEEGSATQPEGLFHALTPSTVATFADVVDLEADVDDANVIGECKYVLSNKAKAALRGMIKGANATGMVYENGEIDGTPALATSNVSGTNYIYGDWSNLAVGLWGSIDVVCDPFSVAKAGCIRLIINAFVDAALLRPDALVAGEVSTD